MALFRVGDVVRVEVPPDTQCSYLGGQGGYFLRSIDNEVMLGRTTVIGNYENHTIDKPLGVSREILESVASCRNHENAGGIVWRRKIGESKIDPSHLCLAQQATQKTPLVLFTKHKFNDGVNSHFFHVLDPTTNRQQSLSWAPNEGSIRAIGSSKDGRRVYICILNDTNPDNVSNLEDHLIFEFSVAKDLPRGQKAPKAIVSQYSLGDVEGKAQRKLIRQRQSAERQKKFEQTRQVNSFEEEKK